MSNSTNAHQQKEAYITVLFNERSGNLEVSHRFLIHDAEHVLGLLFNEKSDLSTDVKTQARFAEYIQQHFMLLDDQDRELSLSTVGDEVDGKFFWVYQEITAPETSLLKVRHTALQEIWDDQTNHINVEKGGKVRSLRLRKENGEKWQEVSLQGLDD